MSRVLHLFFVLIFVATSMVATPLSVCLHSDTTAHAAALVSNEVSVATAAQLEDSAEAVSKKQGSVADIAAGALATFVLPSSNWETPQLPMRAVGWFADLTTTLAGRAVSPLLEPPLN